MLLVRNHEVNVAGPPAAAFGPGDPYDERAGSGTTTVQTTKHGWVIRSFTSLNGTLMNCSGGQMPWGAWVTCEETVNGPDVGADFTRTPNIALTKPHGYVFEVPASHLPGQGQSTREPIRNAGRFAHEAVSFDPRHGHLYLTEDNFAFAVRLLPLPPAPPSDEASAGWRTAGPCRCSRSRASTTRTSRPPRSPGRRTT